MHRFLFAILVVFVWLDAHAQSSLPPCPTVKSAVWTNCFGEIQLSDGTRYAGEWKGNKYHGEGTYRYSNGATYIGMYRVGKPFGQGSWISPEGHTLVEGVWTDDVTVETAGGQWRYAAESNDNVWFVLTRSVKNEGAFRRAWIMRADFKPSATTRALSSRSLEKFDCVNERSQPMTTTAHSGPFGSGDTLYTAASEGRW